MNYRGSYRRLYRNAEAALTAAIEIYNKPFVYYREETFIILTLNAWELLLKAIISKNKQSIYYKKERGKPYQTLSWKDAFPRASKHFPKDLNSRAVATNLDLLASYRNNVVHFYNREDLRPIAYTLGQASVLNFERVLREVVNTSLTDYVNVTLMPVGIRMPVDPIAFITEKRTEIPKRDNLRKFVDELAQGLEEFGGEGNDSNTLLVTIIMSLQSVKKISDAELVVGVDPDAATKIAHRKVDPNTAYPLRRKEILAELPQLNGVRLTSYMFDAIVWFHRIKADSRLCWSSKHGGLTTYSKQVVGFLRGQSSEAVKTATRAYKDHLRDLSQKTGGPTSDHAIE